MRGNFDKNDGTIQKSSLPNEKLQKSEAFNFGVRLIPPFTDRLMRILRCIDLRKVSLPVNIEIDLPTRWKGRNTSLQRTKQKNTAYFEVP